MTFEQFYIELTGKMDAHIKEIHRYGKIAKKAMQDKDIATVDQSMYEMAKIYIDMRLFEPMLHKLYPNLVELFEVLKKEYDEIERVNFMNEIKDKP